MFNYWSRYSRLAFSILAASAIFFVSSAYSGASADGVQHFRFLAVAVASSADSIIFQGDGKFNRVAASGSGSYTEFNPSIGSPPFPIISAGTWRVTRFISFTSPGAYGFGESGILTVGVNLIQKFPTPALIPAVLTEFCNIPPGNLSVGHPEGIQLTEPSKIFTQLMEGTGFSTTPE
jgi:hypothetical protein